MMGKLRIVFMGTPDFSLPVFDCLQEEYEIVAVYTGPDKPKGRGRELSSPPVKVAAKAQGIAVYQPTSLREEAERIEKLCPQAIVVAAYGKIIPPSILDIPSLGCINVHPSLLPRYRGPSPVISAILSGDSITGVTLILLDEGMDTGPILSQKETPILPQDTTLSLTQRLFRLGANLLLETLPLWEKGKIIPKPQDETKTTYSRIIKKEDGEIDFHLSAEEIYRHVKAFYPWPGSYTWWRGQRLKICQSLPLSREVKGKAGEVMALNEPSPARVGIKTGKGVLGLLRVQPEGKGEMRGEDFLRGQKGFVGSILPQRI
jgi:methionyl-tRNA formyltransferase